MSRLTNRFSDGTAFVLTLVLQTVGLQGVVEKLAHYEDLADDGKLLELPCAEGKTVYAPSYTYECEYDYECKEERRFKCEEDLPCKHQYKEYMVRKKKFQPQMLAVLGKTVFLTKEEAEKALEEMREKV